MKFTLKRITANKIESGLVVIPVGYGRSNSEGAASWTELKKTAGESLALLDQSYSGSIRADLQRLDYRAKAGERCSICARPGSAKKEPLFIRLSALSSHSSAEHSDAWRRLAGDALSNASELKLSRVAIALGEVDSKELSDVVQAVVEGVELASYKFRRYRKSDGAIRRRSAAAVKEVLLISSASRIERERPSVALGVAAAEAAVMARDLVNTPAGDLGPRDMVNTARRTAASKRLSCRVYGRQELERMKANLLLAVSAGSSTEPFMVHMTYKPGRVVRGSKKIALVGKGITFDSGGLSIKPSKGMEEMKCDMAGAAAVLSVMKCLAALAPGNAVRHEVHGIFPLCENLVSASSVKPGDVVTGMAGKSVEILNTDAEGRLILADALAYTGRLKPDIIIDLATLTGACVRALGDAMAGLFCKDSSLSEALQESGRRTGEQLWPLPLAREYRKFLESSTADLRNYGSDGPGATTAALFLEEFVPSGAIWAHLDIAGPAFVSRSNEYTQKGGTGFGVRLLLDYLRRV